MPTQIVPEVMTVREVAQELRVSVGCVRRWIANGDLPSLRLPSGGIRVHADDVSGLLKTHHTSSGNGRTRDVPADLRDAP